VEDTLIRPFDKISRRVKIEYLAPLSKLILRAQYNPSLVNDMINDANISPDPVCSCHSPWDQRRNVHLVHFDTEISTQEVLDFFGDAGLRAGTVREYLELVAQHPTLRTLVPAISLGSTIHPYAVSAYNSFDERRLDLSNPHTGKWGWLGWFVAVDNSCKNYAE